MRAIRNAAYVLNNYGQNSSLHGLYHLYQSTDIIRRVFWLIVLLLALAIGVFHTVKSAERYLNLDIFVHVSDEATEAVFPDITLCSIKPFSESLLVQYSSVLDRHFDKHWNYFDNWFVTDRRQRVNESGVAHRKRLKKIFARFLQIFWVSEDSRDLGIDDVSMLLDCSYEGRPCDGRNFTLVRDPDSWNCYKFSPGKDIPVGDKGLQLILFTDSNFYHPISTGSMISILKKKKADGDAVDDIISNIKDWNSLKYFLGSRKRSLNQIAVPSMVQSDGLRLIVHEPGSHPMTSLHRLEFEAGAAGAVSINQMLATRLHRPSKFDCVSKPYEAVRYATEFDTDGNLVLRSFDKLLDAHVVEAKQAMVQRACGCRSHRYPFAEAPASLCYYAPPAERRQPSARLMERMNCHDRTVTQADRQTYQLVKEHARSAACKSMLHTFSTNVYGWPKDEDLDSIVNRYIMQKFLNGTSLLPGDGKKHPIFNFADSEIVNLVGGKNALVSRQGAALKQLLSSNVSRDCPLESKKRPNDTRQDENFWCLKSTEQLRRNLIKLSVRHSRRKSRQATEHYSYQWPEALSELGGICGLWLGVSILTVFELLEVMYLMCSFQMEIPPSKEEGDTIEREGTAGNNDTSIALSDRV